MDYVMILLEAVLLLIVGFRLGWVLRGIQNEKNADGYLHFTIDEIDGSWYPYLDLNYPIQKIANKRCAVFLVEKAKSQK